MHFPEVNKHLFLDVCEYCYVALRRTQNMSAAELAILPRMVEMALTLDPGTSAPDASEPHRSPERRQPSDAQQCVLPPHRKAPIDRPEIRDGCNCTARGRARKG